jgi:hypothetical protein
MYFYSFLIKKAQLAHCLICPWPLEGFFSGQRSLSQIPPHKAQPLQQTGFGLDSHSLHAFNSIYISSRHCSQFWLSKYWQKGVRSWHLEHLRLHMVESG